MKVLPSYTNENYNWTISSSNILLKLIVVTFKYVILFLDTAQYPWTILYLIPALQLSQAHTQVAKAGPVHRSPVHAGFQSIVYFSKQSTYICTGKGLMVWMANAIRYTKRNQPLLRRRWKIYRAPPPLPNPHSPIASPSAPIPFSINWRQLLDKVDCWMRLAAVDGGVTRTQPQWVQHEDTIMLHELFSEECTVRGQFDRINPRQMKMILSFCKRILSCAHNNAAL